MQQLWSSNADWYLHEVSWRYLEQVSSYREDMILWQSPWEITQKVLMQELWFLHSACHLILIDIYMKFREDRFLFVLRFYGPVNPMRHVECGQFT